MTDVIQDSAVPAHGQQKITACAFIHHNFDGVEKVFLPKRADTKKFLPGVYELPGGHIDFGEDLIPGLKREVMEELNQEIVVGDPYGGRQVVFYENEPVWMCVYYGWVDKARTSADDVYDFLREALQYPPDDMPLRGATSYKKRNMEYRHEVPSSIDSFESEETILEDDKRIYWAKFVGGLVDQRFRGSV